MLNDGDESNIPKSGRNRKRMDGIRTLGWPQELEFLPKDWIAFGETPLSVSIKVRR